MSENQHFCLKWNHHQHTIVSLFSSLLDTNTFVDCTLAAGGKQIKAHKMILSACSPYFKEILLEHSDTHPIIILNNLQFTELAAIVEFMYRGEVNVSQDQLPTFLKAANTLQIKGLTNDDDEDDEGSEKGTKKAGRTQSPATPEPLKKIIKTEPGTVPVPMEEESPKDLSVNDSYAMSYHSASEDSAHSSIRLKVDTDDDSHPGAYPIPQAFMKQETYIQSTNSNSTIMGSVPSSFSLSLAISGHSGVRSTMEESVEATFSTTWEQLGKIRTIVVPGRGQIRGALFRENFKFRIYDIVTTSGETQWVCENSISTNCGAEVTTVNDVVIRGNDVHNHPERETNRFTVQRLLHQHQQMMNNVSSEDLPHFSGIGFGKMIQLRRPNATERDAAFKCDECPKFYRSKTSLNLHKRWECGKEPKFACPYCDKKCHQKGNLKVHIISRHRDRINPNENQPSLGTEPTNHMGEPTT